MNKDKPTAAVTSPPHKSPWKTVSLAASSAVFLPILLTKLLYVFPAVRLWVHSVSGTIQMMDFMIYTLLNWLVVITGFLVLREKDISLKDLGFQNFRFSDILLGTAAVIIGFLIYYAAGYLSAAIGLEPIKGMSYSLTVPLNIVTAIIFPGILGPLAEDILFRGFLLNHLSEKIRSRWVVGIIGVVMFTLIHIPYFGLSGALFILLWSPLSVGLFLWRKSIYPSLIFHIMNNIAAYVVFPILFNG